MDILNVDNFKTIFGISRWFTSKFANYPELFTWIIFLLIILSSVTILKGIIFFKNWINNRELLFNSVFESRRQAISHQNKNNSLEYALEAHKKEKIQLIKESFERLPRICPLRKNAQRLIRDLQAVNSFEQSEKIMHQFLSKYKKVG